MMEEFKAKREAEEQGSVSTLSLHLFIPDFPHTRVLLVLPFSSLLICRSTD